MTLKEKYDEYFKEGRAEGFKEGQLKEQLRTTKNLLAEGKTPEEIATWLDIDKNKANKLIKKVNSAKK